MLDCDALEGARRGAELPGLQSETVKGLVDAMLESEENCYKVSAFVEAVMKLKDVAQRERLSRLRQVGAI